MRPTASWFHPRTPLWQLAFWLATGTVFALSVTPVDQLPPQWFDWWDKAQHALGFAILSVLGLLAYPFRASRLTVRLLAFGVLIECAQAAMGWRHGDVLDWIADAVGVVAVMGAYRYGPRPALPA